MTEMTCNGLENLISPAKMCIYALILTKNALYSRLSLRPIASCILYLLGGDRPAAPGGFLISHTDGCFIDEACFLFFLHTHQALSEMKCETQEVLTL